MDLDVDRMVEAACETAGADDFGGNTWREGLERLVEALRSEARLNAIGARVARRDLTQYLVNRLGIVAHRRAHPEVAETGIVPPVVIMGHGRTGTTILHDLLAQDPVARVPSTWEVERPCPPPETATYDTDPRIDATEARLAAIDRVMPELRGMHPMGARLGQEWADSVLDGLDRSVAAREDGTVPRDRSVDVPFRRFMADPLGTLRGVYEGLGLDFTPDVETRMRGFLAAHPRDEHGGHRYTFAATGLDEGELRERARSYQEYFDVPSEPLA